MLSIWKTRIAMLLMLAYTSQSISPLLASCHMDESSSEPKQVAVVESAHDSDMHHRDMHHCMGTDHAAMEHSLQHQDIAADASALSKIDAGKATCCDALGHCLMSGCGVAHAASGTSASSNGDSIAVADLYKLSQPLFVTSSHFRPPIFG